MEIANINRKHSFSLEKYPQLRLRFFFIDSGVNFRANKKTRFKKNPACRYYVFLASPASLVLSITVFRTFMYFENKRSTFSAL